MKLDHIKIKPTEIPLSEINNDVPHNGELFAEAMHDQVAIVKGTIGLPPWVTRGEALSINRRLIQALLLPKKEEVA